MCIPECNPGAVKHHQFLIDPDTSTGQYFRDGKYYGDIVSIEGGVIKIECHNGNQYMEGQIINFINRKS